MIHVESITIRDFRGIRDLSLDFQGQCFAICGPNGTGKSGVVDALEFALTGNVSRLSGEGRGEVSLRDHGPHVDIRSDPDRARVTIELAVPSLNKTVTVSRTLKTPSSPTVTPSDPAVLEVLRQVAAHPEIVLSRREIIRYVIATPGKRAQEVQALLHFDQVERVRVVLQKIANSCERQLAPLARAVAQAEQRLLQTEGISELTTEVLLAAANAQRSALGLPALAQLTETTSLKSALPTPAPTQPQRIPRNQALADMRATREAIAELTADPTTERLATLIPKLIALAADPSLEQSMKREAFYASGVELIGADTCPFCDTSWDPEELKRHVEAKINHLDEISRKRTAAEAQIEPFISAVQKVKAGIDTLVTYAPLASPPLPIDAVRDFSIACQTAVDSLTAFLPLSETVHVLSNLGTVPQDVLDAMEKIEKAVVALPQPTKQDAARGWLDVAQERLDVLRDAKRKHELAKTQLQRARQVSDVYVKTSDAVLTGIYSAVQKDFADLYALLNRDDEGSFTASLIPSTGKLGLGVDFYGRGVFPPGAYHSEGHQDAMGLCLYLALMRHLQGSAFTLAILDDVLMSVDAGHRRQACALLKSEFPKTQFIMTTHDPIWLRHMRTEGLIRASCAVSFRTWNVDNGPTQWHDKDVWTEIADHLKHSDVRAAAALLRHYLEYTSRELCHRLRACPPFHGGDRYQLGELLPAAVGRMRKLYKMAKDAASSWNQKHIVDLIASHEATFAQLIAASKVEQWQVNVAVHYNSWENLTRQDFVPVVDTYRDLLRGFACSDCDEYLRVSPDRETPHALRCECGTTLINLIKKNRSHTG